MEHLIIELAVSISDFDNGLISESGFLSILNASLRADRGPIPGSLANNSIKLSISV